MVMSHHFTCWCMEAVLDHSNLVNRLALILVPRFLSNSMEMSYLHVSLVHSASASSGLPEVAGCFPSCSLARQQRRWVLRGAPKPGGRLQVARPPAAAGKLCGLRGTVLRSGVLKGHWRRADEARPRRPLSIFWSCSPGVLKLTPS